MATASIAFLATGPATGLLAPHLTDTRTPGRATFSRYVSSSSSCCCGTSSVACSSGRFQISNSVEGDYPTSRLRRLRRNEASSGWRLLVVTSDRWGKNLDSRGWRGWNVSRRKRNSRRGGLCMALTDEAVKASSSSVAVDNGGYQQKNVAATTAAEEIAVTQLLEREETENEVVLKALKGEELEDVELLVVSTAGADAIEDETLADSLLLKSEDESGDQGSTAVSSSSSSSPSTSELFQRSEEESQIVRTAWEKLVRWSKSWQLLQSRRQKNALQKTKKIAILGGGSFGTAMGVLLARNKAEMEVTLLLRDEVVCDSINGSHINSKYFPRHKLPLNVRATTDPRAALEGAEYCIHAVPVQSSASFLRSISEFVPPTLPILSVSKGLELSTLEMMSQVIPRALGNPRQPVCVLSGPSFSIELMDELPTALVAASKDKELAKAAQQLLASRYLRVNTSSDVVGVEMAGALKNVLAIAAGIVEGMELGNNCMAALVAQGCAEIRWLAEKMGAKPATLAGLSGTGDIMLTCFVKLSRNRSVGVRLGAGERLEDILGSMNQVAEGVATAGAVIALARKYRVQMPVLTAVARILENELTPKKAVLALMSLPQVEEV
ncbi:hypothetical protein R1flu_022957 [Riccia fluitans]|uniref:Glycerol-3-phosphate dehydrogenase [NAD(+)] n=1 Tax=Riccia fluitans TaxID=41844 RepID=A0ABD1XQQ1_9MARC